MSQRLRSGRDLALLLGFAVFVLMLAPLPAVVALASRPAAASVFERTDVNRDGYVDAAEGAAVPGMRSAFGLADTDADGRLDRAEFARAIGLTR